MDSSIIVIAAAAGRGMVDSAIGRAEESCLLIEGLLDEAARCLDEQEDNMEEAVTEHHSNG